MNCAALILAGSLIGLQDGAGKAGTAADRITLRDGSVVLGLVTSVTGGPRGRVELIVRRDWADKHLKARARRWERAIEAGTMLAARQRRERLQDWLRERAAVVPAADRIIAWIDRELKRLADPARFAHTPLMSVELSRGDVRNVLRQPRSSNRLLQLGWLCGLPDVETMPLGDLQEALEGRGFVVDGDQPPSLSGLLPPTPEPELQWLGRRAATELAIDPDLRFVRYQDMVLPDTENGQDFNGLNLTAALSEVAKLLDPGQGRADPLVASLKKVGERGRVGALVTRLEIAADLGQVTVETTLWVRAGGERWVPFGSRSSSARPDDLAPDAGQNLAGDPRVQAATSLVEALGLGTVTPEIKRRSLLVGAATRKALGTARTVLNQDLDALVLPVFEHPDEGPDQGRRPDKPPGPDTSHRSSRK
jgi:hypothetical protein